MSLAFGTDFGYTFGIELEPADAELLAAVRHGETLAGYAHRHGYSHSWAKQRSARLKARLGAHTLLEAILMAEDEQGGLSAAERAELREIKEELRRAREELRQAATPKERREAREDVASAEDDLERLAKRAGLTREEVEAAQKEKRYREYKEHAARLEEERKLEAAAKPKPKPKPKEEKEEPEEPEEKEEPETREHWIDRPLFGAKR